MAAAPMPLDDMRAAHTLLTTVFGSKSDDLYVVVGTLSPVVMQSFTDIGAAARSSAGRPDVYVHVGLTDREYSGAARPKAAEIAALGGLWADIDIADPVHKKQGYAPDTDAALAIVRAMRLPPGLVVHSGHGLHVWWPFAEVWTFESADERRRAQILARAWAITLRERARELGYTVDMVSDIARVLRVPGTVNAKGEARPVVLLEHTDATINESDVLEYLRDGAWETAEREIDGRGSADATVYGELTLDPKADPPFDKFVALMDLEPRFRQSWEHKRRGKETWSESEYDQSLASYAAQAGWSPQEVANLLIAHRRKWGADLKLRQSYYGPTIAKAVRDHIEQEIMAEVVTAADEIVVARATAVTQGEEPPDVDRVDLLRRVSAALGVEVTRVTRTTGESPVYSLETAAGSGPLGPVSTLIQQRRFREKLAELTQVLVPTRKQEQWDPVCRLLMESAETVDSGIEATTTGRMETLVSVYLGLYQPKRLDRMTDTDQSRLAVDLEPYRGKDGRIRMFASGFKGWLGETQHEPWTHQQIGVALRTWGAEPSTEHFVINGRRTTRAVWLLPDVTGKVDTDTKTSQGET